MRKLLASISMIALFIVYAPACHHEAPVEPRPQPAVITDSNYCRSAGENLYKRGCISDKDKFTRLGKSFEQFCKETQLEGHVWLNPKCLAEIEPNTLRECEDLVNTCTNSK